MATFYRIKKLRDLDLKKRKKNDNVAERANVYREYLLTQQTKDRNRKRLAREQNFCVTNHHL